MNQWPTSDSAVWLATAPDTGLRSRDRANAGQDGHQCTQLPRLSLRAQGPTQSSFASEGLRWPSAVLNCPPASRSQLADWIALSKDIGIGAVITVRADKDTYELSQGGVRTRRPVKRFSVESNLSFSRRAQSEVRLASGNNGVLDPVKGAVYHRHSGPLFRQHQMYIPNMTFAEGSLAVTKVVLPHAQEPLIESQRLYLFRM